MTIQQILDTNGVETTISSTTDHHIARRTEGEHVMPRAVLNGTVLAESDHTVVVEGNHYFPPESVRWDHFGDSSTKTLCPWKGLAGYHDVEIGDVVHSDAGWSYPRPSPLARRIKGHIAFDSRVRVEPTDQDQPRPRRGLLGKLRREPTTAA